MPKLTSFPRRLLASLLVAVLALLSWGAGRPAARRGQTPPQAFEAMPTTVFN